MRHLRLEEVVRLHGLVIAASGGSHGVRDQGALESAVAQPRMTFGGEDLYPTLIEEIILRLAAGQMDRDGFTEWLRAHVHALKGDLDGFEA
jgi:prophage maintenance system killer protein